MTRKAAFIYDDSMSQVVLSDTHPMKPIRLGYTYELLNSYRAFGAPNAELIAPRIATDAEILSHHTPEFLEAVKRYSNDPHASGQSQFNFGPGDNPVFEGIFEAASLLTGASLKAAELLVSDEADVAFNISGGLHHAMPGYASGFCVFNDPVVAIKYLVAQGMRVAYVDIDCHHGDGVQHAFYDTDKVMTISMHESGAFIFPGTGYPQELGAGIGRGYSVNVPLYPYTTDDVYIWAFREIVPPLIQAFRPDVLVTQLGIDSHYLDPITHLALTVQGFRQVVSELAALAPSKWLGLGGGGYDLQAVARAWTSAFGVMSEQTFDEAIPDSYRDKYGVTEMSDSDDLPIDDTVRRDSREFAETNVSAVQSLIFPLHGIRSA